MAISNCSSIRSGHHLRVRTSYVSNVKLQSSWAWRIDHLANSEKTLLRGTGRHSLSVIPSYGWRFVSTDTEHSTSEVNEEEEGITRVELLFNTKGILSFHQRSQRSVTS